MILDGETIRELGYATETSYWGEVGVGITVRRRNLGLVIKGAPAEERTAEELRLVEKRRAVFVARRAANRLILRARHKARHAARVAKDIAEDAEMEAQKLKEKL